MLRFAVRCLPLFVSHCMFDGCLLFVVCRMLLISACRVVMVVCCLFNVDCMWLCVVRCLLFAICCVLSVVV